MCTPSASDEEQPPTSDCRVIARECQARHLGIDGQVRREEQAAAVVGAVVREEDTHQAEIVLLQEDSPCASMGFVTRTVVRHQRTAHCVTASGARHRLLRAGLLQCRDIERRQPTASAADYHAGSLFELEVHCARGVCSSWKCTARCGKHTARSRLPPKQPSC